MTKVLSSEVRRNFEVFTLVREEVEGEGGSVVSRDVYRNKFGSLIDIRRKKRRSSVVQQIAALSITPIKRHSRDKVCTIGKSAVDGKWYGWNASTGQIEGFTASTDKEARKAASVFAKSVA
jgi:hypothetical protein